MDERRFFYIDGGWVAPAGDATLPVRNPATEELIASVPAGTPADVDRAVAAARAAFPAWSRTDPKERQALLGAVRDGLATRAEELARTITREMGAPLRFARQVQVGLPLAVLGSFADLLGEYPFEEQVGSSTVVREAIGVVGAITPWNYPLHQVVAKLAAALAAGATVVLKPSEVAPLTSLLLAEVMEAAGLPPGVVNVVTGTGPVVGEALAGHPGVDMVSFTGGARAGARVAELAARNITKVALELGGKSANVVLDDADLAKAVKVGVANAFINAGQTCTAWSRLIVPADRHEEAVELAVAAAADYAPGDPEEEDTRLGPLVTAAQRDRVRGYVDGAIAEGATLACGGTAPPPGRDRGYYVAPTVLAGVTPQMTVAREEVFGPVLAVLAYRGGDAAAVDLANATDYGLAGAVWSADEGRALAVARGMRTGQVDINGGRFNPLAPFGGYRRSGLGRELGRFGLEEFLEVKSLQH
ncbi:MAG: aldehyde dehydrogenase family protein [Mycobacteriales bacterium]